MFRSPFKNFFRFDGSYWLLVLPVLFVTVPWVQYRVRGIIPFAIVMLWLLPKLQRVFHLFYSREGRAFCLSFFWFSMLMFLQEMYAIFGSQVHMKFYQFATVAMHMVFFFVAFYTIGSRKYSELRFLTVVTLIGFILGGMSSIRGLGVGGLESARVMTGLKTTDRMLSADQIDNAIQVMEIGLGGYSYMYHCAWLIGVLMIAFVLTKDVRLRILYLVTGISAAISVKVGGLGTPVGIIVVQTMIFLLWLCIRNKHVVAVCGFSLVGLFFIYAITPEVFSFLVGPLESIAESLNDGSLRERVISMADAFKGLDSYSYSRAQLQLISFDTFCKHPFFGVFSPMAQGSQLDLGGHSYILDIAGGYGLFGIFILLMFIWSLLRYFRVLGELYFGRKWSIMPVFVMIFFVFSGIMNPVTFFPNFIYLLPGIAWLSLTYQEKSELYWRYNQVDWNYNY